MYAEQVADNTPDAADVFTETSFHATQNSTQLVPGAARCPVGHDDGIADSVVGASVTSNNTKKKTGAGHGFDSNTKGFPAFVRSSAKIGMFFCFLRKVCKAQMLRIAHRPLSCSFTLACSVCLPACLPACLSVCLTACLSPSL